MKPRRDIDDLDENLLDRDEAADRRRERAEMIAAAEARANREAEVDAAANARVKDFTVETNRQMIVAEYRAAGLTPPSGNFVVSLTLLRKLGWTVEDGPGGARLIKQADRGGDDART